MTCNFIYYTCYDPLWQTQQAKLLIWPRYNLCVCVCRAIIRADATTGLILSRSSILITGYYHYVLSISGDIPKQKTSTNWRYPQTGNIHQLAISTNRQIKSGNKFSNGCHLSIVSLCVAHVDSQCQTTLRLSSFDIFDTHTHNNLHANTCGNV